MQAHSLLWHYLWLAPPILLAVIAVTMLRRGLHRDYPMFFSYAVWQAVFGPLLFVLDHLPSVISVNTYQTFNWVDDLGSIVLRFAIIYEIFIVLFRPYRALKQLVSGVISVGLVALLAVSVAAATPGPSAGHWDWAMGALLLLDRAVFIIQCGLLIMLFGLSWFFNLSWRSYVFGIAVGFGFFAATQIAISSLHARATQIDPLNFIAMGSYHVCVLIWALYLFVPERAETKVASVPAFDLESWNQELERLLQK
jgi:hypothetical protein